VSASNRSTSALGARALALEAAHLLVEAGQRLPERLHQLLDGALALGEGGAPADLEPREGLLGALGELRGGLAERLGGERGEAVAQRALAPLDERGQRGGPVGLGAEGRRRLPQRGVVLDEPADATGAEERGQADARDEPGAEPDPQEREVGVGHLDSVAARCDTG
jgi:hypothetical protein